MITGNYPARFSVHQHFATPEQNHERGMPDWLDPKAPSLPRFLKQAGYRTAHFGKWHLTNRETRGAPKPETYGYDVSAVFNGGADWESADLHAISANTVAFIKAKLGPKAKPTITPIASFIHQKCGWSVSARARSTHPQCQDSVLQTPCKQARMPPVKPRTHCPPRNSWHWRC